MIPPINHLVYKFNLFYFIALGVFVCLLHLSFGYQLKLIYVVGALAFFILLLSTSKLMYIFALVFYALLGMIYAPVGVIYGYPDVNSIGSLVYTDWREAVEFAIGLPYLNYFYVAGLLCFLVFLIVQCPSNTKRSFFLVFVFVVTAFWSSTKDYVTSNIGVGSIIFDSGLPEFRFFRDIFESYNQVVHDNTHYANVIKNGDTWLPYRYKNKYNTYFVVIGESVRKDFMHAYGFQYVNNTPWMSNANGVIFNDFVSASGSTQLSLTYSMAKKDKKNNVELNNSIVSLAKKAGFFTYWLSNQGGKGGFDSPVAMLGKQADYSFFTKKWSSDDRRYIPDETLLPYVYDIMRNDREGSKVIFIHLMGSHPQACIRTNWQYDFFWGSENVSCYIQSIKNTDSFLSEIVNKATEIKLKWAMIYFSDHGLKFSNAREKMENLTHGDNYKQNFQVPFFMTDYDNKEREYITHQRSGFSLLPILAEWMGIKEPSLMSDCDLWNDVKCDEETKVLNFKKEYIFYSDLDSDDIP